MIISRARVFTDRSASGVVTSAQNVPISTIGAGTVSVDVSGTWEGTLGFEATIDGVNWVPAEAYQILPTGIAESSTTVNGNWSLNVAGFNAFRVIGQTVTSGTANVYLDASQASPGIPSSVVIDTSASPPLTITHNEISLIASGIESVVLTLAATIQPIRIFGVDVSGENVALFRVKVNGTTISNKRSWWGNFNQSFQFPQNGMVLNVGQTLTVTALHNRPNLSNFEATVLSN